MKTNLKPCPDCGREVSKEAAACPNCGRKLNQSAVLVIWFVLGAVITGLLLVLAAVVGVAFLNL